MLQWKIYCCHVVSVEIHYHGIICITETPDILTLKGNLMLIYQIPPLYLSTTPLVWHLGDAPANTLLETQKV